MDWDADRNRVRPQSLANYKGEKVCYGALCVVPENHATPKSGGESDLNDLLFHLPQSSPFFASHR
ncbi:hypothetical protein CN090_34555 [Sinorhizobium meliloti]|nr:hypothetical protein CN199_31655 [Sinorhizobium meliloti]RVL11019.1 hypothetical protein CN143_32525 [Sinorhizobium meliloti]RVL28598.1 hypothetical protein CN148_30275 [Sinorhizobium meliloti]RVM22837.1 hypothetical protein CN130_32725 [Sinorhizobium meliloti]RVN05133.1 hypothetical protein CN115_27765 [Sinorhizobium meliloti]